MVSEINGLGGGVLSGLNGPAAGAPSAPPAQINQPPSGLSANVHLTDVGTQLQALTAAVADQLQVDPTRVTDVRQSLTQGTYQIEPQVTADKLIAVENLMGSGH